MNPVSWPRAGEPPAATGRPAGGHPSGQRRGAEWPGSGQNAARRRPAGGPRPYRTSSRIAWSRPWIVSGNIRSPISWRITPIDGVCSQWRAGVGLSQATGQSGFTDGGGEGPLGLKGLAQGEPGLAIGIVGGRRLRRPPAGVARRGQRGARIAPRQGGDGGFQERHRTIARRARGGGGPGRRRAIR